MRSDVKIAILIGLVAALVTAYYFTRKDKDGRQKLVVQADQTAAVFTPQSTAARPTPRATPTAFVWPTPTQTATIATFHLPTLAPATQRPGPAPTRMALPPPSPTPPPTATPAPTPTPKVEQPITHIMAEGETLSSLAEQYYGDPRFWQRIAKANPRVNPNRPRIGDRLIIEPKSWFDKPGARPTAGPTAKAQPTPKATGTPRGPLPETYVVQKGDSLIGISRKLYGTPKRANDIYEANKHIIGSDPAGLRPGMKLNVPE